MDQEELYKLKAFIEKSPNRAKILSLLKVAAKPMKPTEMAEKMKVSRNTISTRVMDLERKGLVKLLNPEVNQNRYYRITEKGVKVIQRINSTE